MSRCVVNVATGHYRIGQQRLLSALGGQAVCAFDEPLPSWPTHIEKPYAFKAYALKYAEALGHSQLLWADACIVPTGSLDRIWQHTAEHGVWLSRNGYWNFEWTANDAYGPLGITPEENKTIQHVVATAFAVDLTHPKGAEFLSEYYRLASQTRAFRGPWVGGIGIQHRHDQSAASVIAHRLGIPLTEPPDFFSYRGSETRETVLIADGNY
jgi:hypothetical protein